MCMQSSFYLSEAEPSTLANSHYKTFWALPASWSGLPAGHRSTFQAGCGALFPDPSSGFSLVPEGFLARLYVDTREVSILKCRPSGAGGIISVVPQLTSNQTPFNITASSTARPYPKEIFSENNPSRAVEARHPPSKGRRSRWDLI